jgi:hypothetical protein
MTSSFFALILISPYFSTFTTLSTLLHWQHELDRLQSHESILPSNPGAGPVFERLRAEVLRLVCKQRTPVGFECAKGAFATEIGA